MAGQGQGEAKAWFDPERVSTPADFLTERLGALAWSRMEDEPPDPPAPKRRATQPQPAAAEYAAPDEPDDSSLWSADDPGWTDEPGWAPDNWHDLELEGDIMTLDVPDDGCWLRTTAPLLEPGGLYPVVTMRRSGMEPISDMIRVGGRMVSGRGNPGFDHLPHLRARDAPGPFVLKIADFQGFIPPDVRKLWTLTAKDLAGDD